MYVLLIKEINEIENEISIHVIECNPSHSTLVQHYSLSAAPS